MEKMEKNNEKALIKLRVKDKDIFKFEFEDKNYEEYEDKNEYPFYKFLRELHDLQGGKEIFIKYGAWIDIT